MTVVYTIVPSAISGIEGDHKAYYKGHNKFMVSLQIIRYLFPGCLTRIIKEP